MINYYYELEENVKMYGGTDCRYLAQFDSHPGEGTLNWGWHDEAVKNSRRVWLENANGVSLVKTVSGHATVDPVEFTWIKLKCRDIRSLM